MRRFQRNSALVPSPRETAFRAGRTAVRVYVVTGDPATPRLEAVTTALSA
ncbi:MAG TPA: hypothetical protein VFJ75_04330 [Gaiellaceae bacterium]|nr:hypothetical protein [Gaiellaceae bacterium]